MKLVSIQLLSLRYKLMSGDTQLNNRLVCIEWIIKDVMDHTLATASLIIRSIAVSSQEFE